jgi:hypothetical protein
MLSRTIAAFCIIDDALQAMGHKDDPQTKVPSSVILTLAILAAMELGGKHNKALALAKDLNLFTHVPSPSRFNRRLIQPPKLRHFYPASRVMSCMLCPSASSITSFGVR